MIGALSLVIVVWLGTSMNCSRMSTLTGRSMIGIRNRRPGSRTRPSLVLPSRNTTICSYCWTTRTDRYRIDQHEDDEERRPRGDDDDVHGYLRSGGGRRPIEVPSMAWRVGLDERRVRPVEPDDADRRVRGRAAGRQPIRAVHSSPRDVGRAERLERRLDDAVGARTATAGRRPCPPGAACAGSGSPPSAIRPMNSAAVDRDRDDQRQRHPRRPARTGRPGSVYRADAPSAKQMIPPIASRPWLVTVSSRPNSTSPSTISIRPATLSGRLPKPMNARMSASAAEDAGHEVGVLELGEQAGRAEA